MDRTAGQSIASTDRQQVRVGLLEQFLAQECTPHVRRLLEDAVADQSQKRPHFEFNRFEVTVERVSNVVVLQDVLDATETGEQQVTLDEFARALSRCSA